jgi:hypothetical protein
MLRFVIETAAQAIILTAFAAALLICYMDFVETAGLPA